MQHFSVPKLCPSGAHSVPMLRVAGVEVCVSVGGWRSALCGTPYKAEDRNSAKAAVGPLLSVGQQRGGKLPFSTRQP